MLTLTKIAKIVKIVDNKRVYRDFLLAIEKTTFIFVKIYELQIKTIIDYKTLFFTFIEIFRYYIRMKKIRKKKLTTFNSTFVTDKNKKIEKINNRDLFRTFSFRKQQQRLNLCYYKIKHLYDNCFYFNEKICSQN